MALGWEGIGWNLVLHRNIVKRPLLATFLSCPALCRASASSSHLWRFENVDGRDKPGHDEP